MPASARRATNGLADARRLSTSLAAEIRAMRISAGVSQATAARAAGMSRSQWGRLERGEDLHPDLVELCCAGRALGQQLSSRFYPVESPVRDAPQLALLRRFEEELRSPLRMRREVPLQIVGDLRAWDAAVDGDAQPFFVEGETRAGDAQALERRIRLKQRDDSRASVIILLLARGAHNRAFVRDHREVFRDLLPIDAPAILRAVRAGRRPPASGILVI